MAKVGKFHCKYIDTVNMTLNPIDGNSSEECSVRKYDVWYDDESWKLVIGFVTYSNSQNKDVRCIDYSGDSPQVLHRLKNGLRMGVKLSHDLTEQNGRYMLELSQARPNENHSNLYQADLDQICKGAKVKQSSLKDHFDKKNIKYGKRREFFHTNSPRNNYLVCFIEQQHIRLESIMLYLLTRIAPLFYDYRP